MKVVELLTTHFEKKKTENQYYSLRLLAQRTGISVSYLSLIFSGKRKLRPKHLEVLSEALDLDRETKNDLYYQLLSEEGVGKVQKKDLHNHNFNASRLEIKQQGASRLDLLKPWYSLPVLDATLLVDFDGTREWLAEKLDLPLEKIRTVVDSLIEKGLLVEKDNRLRKTDEKIEFRTSRDSQKLRDHHIEFLDLAKSTLEMKTDEKDLDRRLIAGMTVVISKEKAQEIKGRLNNLLYEVLEHADNDKNTTEIYRLSLQFFPLNQV